MKKIVLSIALFSSLSLFGVSFLLKNSTEDLFNKDFFAPTYKNLSPEQMLKPAYQYQKIEVSEENRTESGEPILTFMHFEKLADAQGPFLFEERGDFVAIPLTRMPEENEKFKIIKSQDAQWPQFIITPVFEPSLQERIAQLYRNDPSLKEEAKQLPALMQVQLKIGYGAEGKTVEEIEQLQQAEK